MRKKFLICLPFHQFNKFIDTSFLSQRHDFEFEDNILISDEIESNDFHVGFFGNKIISEKIIEKLK
jgi:hypothetical protein